jgi:hypothetical protein
MGSGATDLDGRADGITLDVEHRDRGKMLGCLVRCLAGSLHLVDTGVGQQDHEWGVVAPALSPGRDQVLALQIPADGAELLIGQIQVPQQPAAADMGHRARLGRFVNRVHDTQTVSAVPGDVGHRAHLPA